MESLDVGLNLVYDQPTARRQDMTKTKLALALALALMPSTAQAKAHHHKAHRPPHQAHQAPHQAHKPAPAKPKPATPAPAPIPAPTEAVVLASAEQAASSYWHDAAQGNPACGVPTIQIVSLAGTGHSGQATYAACLIQIDTSVVQDALQNGLDYLTLASLMTHEWGHLVLGGSYFTSNPADPAHSADPHSIMWAGPLTDPTLIVTHEEMTIPAGLGKATYRANFCTVNAPGQVASEPCTFTDGVTP